MNSEHSKTTGIVIGVVLVLAGMLGGYAIGKNMDDSSSDASHSHNSQTETSKASDLRANLVAMGVEHMNMTDQAVADALDGSPAADASAKALYANGTDLGAAVGSIYGKDAETTFNTVWKLHLDQFVKYAVAGKSGDANAKQSALDTIDAQYTKPLAQYLAKANPNLPEKTLETALRDHVDMTAQMIDYHVAGDYPKEADELKMANKHIEGLMSTLAGGIVKQFPEKFKD
jgi:hypothetical protein